MTRRALAAAALALLCGTGCRHDDAARKQARADLGRCLARLEPPEGVPGRPIVLDAAALLAACPPVAEGSDEAQRLARAARRGVPGPERSQALAGTPFRCIDAEGELAAAKGEVPRGRRFELYRERCGHERYGFDGDVAARFLSEETFVAARVAGEMVRRLGAAHDRVLSESVRDLMARLRLLAPLPAVGMFAELPAPPELPAGQTVPPPLSAEERGGIVIIVGARSLAVALWPLLVLNPAGRWAPAPALGKLPWPGRPIANAAGDATEWSAALAAELEGARDALTEDDPRFRAVQPPLVVLAGGEVAMARVGAAIDAAAPGRGSPVELTLAVGGDVEAVRVRAVGRVDDAQSGPTLIVGPDAAELLEEHSRITLRRVAVAAGTLDARSLGDELRIRRRVEQTLLRVRARPDTPYAVFVQAIVLAHASWGDDVRWAGLAAGAPSKPQAVSGKVTVVLDRPPDHATRLEISELRKAVPGLTACYEDELRRRGVASLASELRLVAAPDGTVTDAGLVGGGGNEQLETCAASVVRTWRLPESAMKRTLHLGVRAEKKL